MEVQKNDIALLVHSCDRYEILYKGFEFFFNKHWNDNINCNKYFATEEIDTEIKGFKNIKSGRGEWADRLRFLLEEKITEPYVMYWQEDMWLNKNVNQVLLNELFKLISSNNWLQLKLHSSHVYKTIPTEIYVEGYNIAKLDNQNSSYLMSHQVTLWNREFLIKQLYKKEHPWRNERKGTKRLKKLNPAIYHVDCFSENGENPTNQNYNIKDRSEYRTISNNGMLNNYALDYIDHLDSVDSLKEYAIKLRYNYDYKLTHDGMPKPKKTDIYKRLKKWFKRKISTLKS